jgi:hypothetical protein
VSDGLEALEAYAERLRALPELAREAAPEVADVVRDELERQIKAGTDPEGKAWAKREDGGQPLETASKSLAVTSVDSRIFARLRGHVARHHLGRARGGVERQILPTKIPGPMGRAIARVLGRRFQDHMGGGDA